MEEKLKYVADALKLIKSELAGEKALLGFAGSPWTLATYMVEGGSSKDFKKIKSLFYSNPRAVDQLMEKLTKALIDYLRMQKASGADAVQIFDSWGGILSGDDYEAASLRWVAEIVNALKEEIPIIIYAKGTIPHLKRQSETGARAVAVDWTIPIREAADQISPDVAVQGNLDPVILDTSAEIVVRKSTDILRAMANRPGHIFNLGHGILPTARIENMEALVDTVVNFGS